MCLCLVCIICVLSGFAIFLKKKSEPVALLCLTDVLLLLMLCGSS